MSQPPALSADSAARRSPTAGGAWIFIPLLVWVLAQMAALALAAFRVPLSARFPSPPESMAAMEIVVVQTILGAMLFPALFQSILSTVVTLGTSILLFEFAGFISAEGDNWRLGAAAVFVVLWLACLAAWATVLRSDRARMTGIAVALLLSAGGAMLAYLDREFAHKMENFPWPQKGWMGPTVGALSILQAGKAAGTAWYSLGIAIPITLISVAGQHWIARSTLKRASPPPPSGPTPHDLPQE